MKCRKLVDEDCGNGCVIYWSQRNGSRVPVRALCGHIVNYNKLGLSRVRQRPSVCRACSGQRRAENNWRKRSGVAAVDAGSHPNRYVFLDVRSIQLRAFHQIVQGTEWATLRAEVVKQMRK